MTDIKSEIRDLLNDYNESYIVADGVLQEATIKVLTALIQGIESTSEYTSDLSEYYGPEIAEAISVMNSIPSEISILVNQLEAVQTEYALVHREYISQCKALW